MKNLIKIGAGMSTMGILRQELDHIEHSTGYRPEDWLSDIYDFIEFIAQHYQHLNNAI